ncbi:MAG: class I tRNA ligase family protein [Actinomycetota bacterium]
MARFYISTPIFYANDAPHVGSAYCTVNADAIARFQRLLGKEVFSLTGTDEHGQKIADAASSHDVSPQAWTDQTSMLFREAWDGLDIAYDDFIRTTEPRHRETVQAFLSKIHDRGFIYKGMYSGLYCVSCEDYYTEDALVDEKCPVHGKPVVEMSEDNYFFKLSAFQDQLLAWYEANPTAVQPETKRNEALSFIRGGLQDISITRTSLTWGVPVPWDSDHVFYVWYDALINYLTAIGYGVDQDRFNEWWPAVHHLVGKEILRFHCVWWPAMCMAAGIEPPANIFVHGWLLVGGKKLSKSMATDDSAPVKLTDIAPKALTEDFGVDPIRYYLLRETALGNDGDFSLEGIVSRYNSDLANNLGNLVARVATVVGSKCGGVGPAPDPSSAIAAFSVEVVGEAVAAWTNFQPSAALEATWRLIGAANSALETVEPWKQEPGPAVDAVLGDCLEILRLVAILASPAMPSVTREIWRRIGLSGEPTNGPFDQVTTWGGYPGGIPVEKGEPLFPRRKP